MGREDVRDEIGVFMLPLILLKFEPGTEINII
jgi:hypothetical protein